MFPNAGPADWLYINFEATGLYDFIWSDFSTPLLFPDSGVPWDAVFATEQREDFAPPISLYSDIPLVINNV